MDKIPNNCEIYARIFKDFNFVKSYCFDALKLIILSSELARR